MSDLLEHPMMRAMAERLVLATLRRDADAIRVATSPSHPDRGQKRAA